MKRVFCIVLFASTSLMAQITTPAHLFGGGVAYNSTATPNFMGDVFYASNISAGTFSYSSVDITKVSTKPFSVETQTETGVAQFMRSVGKVDLFTTLAAGTAVTGSGSLGGSFSGGYLLTTKIHGNWYVALFGKAIHSTVDNNAVSFMAGLNIGFGK